MYIRHLTLSTSLAPSPTTQVEKVLGVNSPAHQAGIQAGDVLVNVQDKLVTMMTHPQVAWP